MNFSHTCNFPHYRIPANHLLSIVEQKLNNTKTRFLSNLVQFNRESQTSAIRVVRKKNRRETEIKKGVSEARAAMEIAMKGGIALASHIAAYRRGTSVSYHRAKNLSRV